MQRAQLEHIIRAAAGITGAMEIVIIGSQAVLAHAPDAPAELLASIEADVFTFRDSDDASLIDGSIGEGSPFHRTFGYYAHGVGKETAVLPSGWRKRLVVVSNENTGGAKGLCLEIHDLAVSKLVAGREKDQRFIAALLQYRLADNNVILERLKQTDLDPQRRKLAQARLKKLAT